MHWPADPADFANEHWTNGTRIGTDLTDVQGLERRKVNIER